MLRTPSHMRATRPPHRRPGRDHGQLVLCYRVDADAQERYLVNHLVNGLSTKGEKLREVRRLLGTHPRGSRAIQGEETYGKSNPWATKHRRYCDGVAKRRAENRKNINFEPYIKTPIFLANVSGLVWGKQTKKINCVDLRKTISTPKLIPKNGNPKMLPYQTKSRHNYETSLIARGLLNSFVQHAGCARRKQNRGAFKFCFCAFKNPLIFCLDHSYGFWGMSAELLFNQSKF